MDDQRPDPFILLGVGDTAGVIDDTADMVQEGDRCSVPGCGHRESVHMRNHCRECHGVDRAVRKAQGLKPGMCLHYYFPPGEPGDT